MVITLGAPLRLIAVAGWLAATGAVLAQENEPVHHEAKELKHHIAGIHGGFTHADDETEFTIGLEYEYRFTELFGVGAIAEYTPESHGGEGSAVYIGLVHLHPWRELRLSVGFGQEDIFEAGAKSGDIWRFSVGYAFEVGDVVIAPAIDLDRIDGHTVEAFGITIHREF